jgi:hypothetical protein
MTTGGGRLTSLLRGDFCTRLTRLFKLSSVKGFGAGSSILERDPFERKRSLLFLVLEILRTYRCTPLKFVRK